MQQEGDVHAFKKGSGVWLFSGLPFLRASNSWNQTSIRIKTLPCAWIHAHVHRAASHLHGTPWCWECDVHLDSSEKRPVRSSPRQSYSASPAVRVTTPGEKQQRNREEWSAITVDISCTICNFQNFILNIKIHLRIRNHERLALHTHSKVRHLHYEYDTNAAKSTLM